LVRENLDINHSRAGQEFSDLVLEIESQVRYINQLYKRHTDTDIWRFSTC